MHFLQHLLQYMLPVQLAVIDQNGQVPRGDTHVVTYTGADVTTYLNEDVVAKTS